jgi:transposase
MIDRRTVFEIHRLKDMGFSARQIAAELRIDRNSVKKYLETPEVAVVPRKPKASKLDAYRELIDSFLEQYPNVHAPVVLQRLQKEGFTGRITIVRGYLHKRRMDLGRIKNGRAFIRFESAPGEQLQIDWGHFGSLTYGTTKRKLYALAVTESYSRMLYIEFTHSQRQEALHQGLLNAFTFLGGTGDKLIVDNMLTAVTERVGHVIRFNDAFLDFLRVFKIVPVACNVGAAHEKGKIERSISYIRRNFWPLRTFTDLADVQNQVNQWRDTVANVRVHQTTGDKPLERSARLKLRPLPERLPDCRETEKVMVHKDYAVIFDSNHYTAPPWTVGKHLTLKADHGIVTLYHLQKQITAHFRSWERKQRIELPSHREQVRKLQHQLWKERDVAIISSLCPEAIDYLAALVEARQPVKKSASRLLALKDEYGDVALIYAIRKALAHKAYGADYVQNILHQEKTPQRHHPPVRLKNEDLNHIRLSEPLLADYDAYILKRRHDD